MHVGCSIRSMPDFELYERRLSRGRAAEPGLFVTVTRRAVLVLSRDLFEALGSPLAVKFLSSREDRLAAIRPVPRGEGESYSVAARSRTVSALAFCRFLGLDHSVARRYPVRLEDGLAVFDVSRPGTVVTSNRAAR